MHGGDVLPEGAIFGKCTVAIGASMRAFACVCSRMYFEVNIPYEAGGTTDEIAFEGSSV
jgi:hypothetical protein